MLVGTNYQSINPKVGCQMEGYTSRLSTGIHDDLTESVFYLSTSKFNMLFVSLDLIAVPGYRADRIKRQIFEEYKIPEKQIIIATIHTHSGPTVTDLLLDYPKISENYWRMITLKVIQSIQRALENLKEGILELVSSEIDKNAYTNRNDPNFDCNRQILEARFKSGGELRASLLLFASHPTVMNVNNTLLSADIIGGIREKYVARFGIRPVIMLADCGDTSTRYTRNKSSFSEVNRISDLIVDSLQSNINGKKLNFDNFKLSEVNIESRYDPISNTKSNRLWYKINELVEKSREPAKNKLIGFLNTYKHIRYFGHTHFKTTAYIYDFDNFRIVTYPGELVYKLGDKIRKANEKTTFLITLANDYRGYSVDREDFGKYFESYNSVFLVGEADNFVNNIVEAENN